MRSTQVLAASLLLLPFAACDCGLDPLYLTPGNVVGTACFDATGAPAAGDTVVLQNDEGDFEAVVEADGSFHFDDVKAGTATVRLPGGRELPIVIESDSATIVSDPACAAVPDDEFGLVTGRVCNRHIGEPVTDARVFIELGTGAFVEDDTDAQGRFVIRDVPAGSWVLSVFGTGFQRNELIEVEGGEETVVDVGGACGIPAPGDYGAVQGRVCAPDGTTWLSEARASITPAVGEEVFTFTDGDGRYLLENVPAGPQTLHIEKGSFSVDIPVVIPPGDTLTLPEEECAIEVDNLRIAVVTGSQYDNVQGVLDDVGVDADVIDVFGSNWADQLLGGDERVFDYDILFLSCRSAEPAFAGSSVMQERLRRFVAEGGSLHASDQAYDLIEIAFPTKIDFFGNDNERGAADEGQSVENLTALVENAGLSAALGTNTVRITYALQTWSAMLDVAADVHVYVTADSPLIGGDILFDAPQIVGFDHGDGRVIYSSFHQEPGMPPDQERILQLLLFEL